MHFIYTILCILTSQKLLKSYAVADLGGGEGGKGGTNAPTFGG